MLDHLSSAAASNQRAANIRQRLSSPSRQSGMGFWGYVMALLAVAVVITLGLRLGPHYMNQRTVVTIIESLGTDVHRMEKRKIRELLKKRFKINTLYDLDSAKIIEIDRTKEHTKLNVSYEKREPMAYNVDAVLTFKDEFEFR